MGEQELRVVEQVQELLESDDVVADLNDEEQARIFMAEMMHLAEPEFEVAMVASPTAGGARTTRTGVEGFREAWVDWTGPFESYRIEVEDTFDAGDRVVTFVRQGGVTKTGGVELKSEAAAVWTVRGDRVSAVEFHLDR